MVRKQYEKGESVTIDAKVYGTMENEFIIRSIPDFKVEQSVIISYDVSGILEVLPSLAEDDVDIPDIFFLLFDSVCV